MIKCAKVQLNTRLACVVEAIHMVSGNLPEVI